jgi:hypothetical protein
MMGGFSAPKALLIIDRENDSLPGLKTKAAIKLHNVKPISRRNKFCIE